MLRSSILTIFRAFALIVVSTSMVGATTTEKVALVIGNGDYGAVPKLKNPRNDAQDLAMSLESIGFDVTTAFDLDQSGLLRGLREFQSKARQADVALIYYAGHGIEVGKQNYLIPTDAKLETDRDVPFETVELDNAVLAASGARLLSLVIVDACRNNPFAGQMTRTAGFRSIGRGLAEVEPQGNTLVAFAAKAGTVAADGAGRNSPYAMALLESLAEPKVEVGLLFRQVRDRVIKETRGAQEPFFYGSLSSTRLYLNETEVEEEPVVVAAAAPTSQPAPAVAAEPDDLRTQSLVWSAIKDSQDPSVFQHFLETYPDGPFVPFASLALKRLDATLAKPDLAPAEPMVAAPAIEEPEAPRGDIETQKTDAIGTPKPIEDVDITDQDVKVVIVTPDASPLTTPTKDEPLILEDAKPILASRNEVREIQERLTILELRPGPIDGLSGRRTAAAIMEFEKQKNLQASGVPSVRILELLRQEVSLDKLAEFRAAEAERKEAARRAAAERRRAAAAANAAAAKPSPTGAPSKTAAQIAAEAAAAKAAELERLKRRRARLAASDDNSSSGGSSGGSSSGSSSSSSGGGGSCGLSC